MTLDVRGVFVDAWSMWRRDRGLLIWVAAFFLFLPQFAVLLFVPAPPQRPDAVAGEAQAAAAQFHLLIKHYGDNALPLILAGVVALFGNLVVMTLYLADGRPALGSAITTALRILPAFLVVALLTQASVNIGLILLIIPGLFIEGRLILSGAIFAAEQPVSAIAAIRRSIVRTRGRNLILAGFATILIFAGYVISAPLVALSEALDRAPLANPVSGAIIDAALAAVVAAAGLGAVLIRVALYRRIGASNGI
jgi:hypothetical protein